MYEAVEFVERKAHPAAPPEERSLGTFPDETDAVDAARAARDAFDHPEDYAWWLVRQAGATLARWIADSRTRKEFALDLTSGELVEVK